MAGLMTGLRSNLETRKREWLIHTSIQEQKLKTSSPSTFRHDVMGCQETVSEGHRWPPRLGEPFYDRGGPFMTRKIDVKGIKSFDNYADSQRLGASYDYALVKGAMPTQFINTPSQLLPTTLDTQLTAEGTIALNQMRPTAPVSGVGVTLGELREGLPRLIGAGLLKATMADMKNQRRFLKEGSDEYLNWEFGWKPLVSDLHDASKAILRSEKIIKQLYRDSGRDVRRRFGFPVLKTTTSDSFTGRYPHYAGNGLLTGNSGTLMVSTENLRTVWVSGMCRYYIPPESERYGRIQKQAVMANKLLGLRPDPELLWQLAPWSWLVDWVSDVGSLVGNLTSFAFDGLVWKYAYLMEHQVERKRYSLVGYRTYRGVYPHCAATKIRESKRRVSATPFGFGLKLDSFTLRQWSILAALGISRGNIDRP